MKKNRAFLLGAATMLAMSLSNFAKAQDCSSECHTSTVSLNTGYDYTTSAVYSVGQKDEWWQVVQVPSGDAAAPIAPFCPYVINNDISWDPYFTSNPTGSKWINLYPTGTNNFNNWSGGACGKAQDNPYRFERKFNICGYNLIPEPYSCSLQMQIMADDLVDKVWVDGVVVKDFSNYLCPGGAPNYKRPFTNVDEETVSVGLTLTNGPHTVWVDMRNIGGKFSGINILGSITTYYPIFAKATCYGQNTCSTSSNESDCFHSAALNITYNYSDPLPTPNCHFTATANVVPTTGSHVTSYLWSASAGISDVPSGNTATATVANGLAHGTIQVIVNGVDANGNSCAILLDDVNMGCNGGTPVQKIPQASGANTNNEPADKSISIYPNPTNDYVTVESKSGTINRIQVYDITGKILADNKYSNVSSQKISLASYAAGTYMIKVNDGTTQIINKVK